MSFYIEILAKDPISVEEIPDKILNQHVGQKLRVSVNRFRFFVFRRRKIVQFGILELKRDKYPLLSDQANWHDEVWKLNPEVLPDLINIIKNLAEICPAFSFKALWVGDPIKHKKTISIADLIKAVATNNIKNFTEYMANN